VLAGAVATPVSVLPTVRGWPARVAQVARIVTQAFPGGEAPAAVTQALDQVWETSRQSSQLEGEVSTHVARLEALERQSRGLRAEIGRRVEELAREESRLRRDAANDNEELERLRVRLAIAEEAVAGAKANVEELELQKERTTKLMSAFERLGAAVAAAEARREALAEREERAKKRDQQLAELREQIEKQRGQLAQSSEAVEQELAREHARVGARSDEERALQRRFRDACALLHREIQRRPVSDALAEELATVAGLGDRTPTAVAAVPKKGPARA
jgi:serine/threonine-protein kinase